MKITKKLRNHILNAVAEIALEKLSEHCPEVKDDTPPEMWDADTRRKFDLITEVTTAIESRLGGKLSAMVLG